MKEPIKGLMSAQTVAHRFGMHVNTLKHIEPSLLPFCRITRRGDRRYDPVDVERYIRERLIDTREV